MSDQPTNKTLDLNNIDTSGAVVRIDGTDYGLRAADGFSLSEAAKMASLQRKWNVALQKVMSDPEETEPAEQAETALTALVCMLVEGLQADIAAKLSFRQKVAVLDFFGQQHPEMMPKKNLAATSQG